jgi:hypothetical protein
MAGRDSAPEIGFALRRLSDSAAPDECEQSLHTRVRILQTASAKSRYNAPPTQTATSLTALVAIWKVTLAVLVPRDTPDLSHDTFARLFYELEASPLRGPCAGVRASGRAWLLDLV